MRVFTLLGPSQSGKTTLAAALASLEGKPGKSFHVDGVGSATSFSFMGDPWAVLDMAGGTENLGHAGPVLAASDAAVLCVPPDASAAALAAPYLRLLEDSDVPSLIFVNRMDAAHSRVSEIAAALQTYCTHPILLRQVPLRDGTEIVGAVDLISERAWKYQAGQPSALVALPEAMQPRESEAREELLEALADFDDGLMEQLIEDKIPLAADVYDVATQTVQHHDLLPCLLGSAENRNGVFRLMKSLRHEAPDVAQAKARLGKRGAAIAAGLLADQVKHLGKTVLIRAFENGLRSGSQVAGSGLGNLTTLTGGTALGLGEIGQAVKSDHLNLGQSYGTDSALPLPGWARAHGAAHRRVVTPVHDKDDARLSAALERLTEIDPALSLAPDPASGHAILGAQGPQHMRRLVQLLEDSFGIKVTLAPVSAALRETITRPVAHRHRHRKQSGGAGQFADVSIDLFPQPRASGFHFEETVKGGAVPKNYIPSVEAGAKEALAAGPNGFPVVDVGVGLRDGKHHSVDSSDYAFRMAGKNAVKEALEQAGSIVLQPIMRLRIHVPAVFTGGLVPIVSGLKGQVLGFEAHEFAAGWDVFETLLPMAALDELGNALASATRGTAWFESAFDHYQEVYAKDLAHA